MADTLTVWRHHASCCLNTVTTEEVMYLFLISPVVFTATLNNGYANRQGNSFMYSIDEHLLGSN